MSEATVSNVPDYRTVSSAIRPSKALRRHFMSFSRQVIAWSEKLDSRPFSIGITGLEKRLGTSTVSFNLASALAASIRQKVLFVESDFGQPYLNRRRSAASEPGLSEVITGAFDAHEVIKQFDDEPLLFAMTAGQANEIESVELPLNNLRPVISDQLHEFECVVFDLPIADGLTACDSLATQLDGIALVVDAGDIDARQIESFRNRMQRIGVEIIGLVINKSKS